MARRWASTRSIWDINRLEPEAGSEAGHVVDAEEAEDAARITPTCQIGVLIALDTGNGIAPITAESCQRTEWCLPPVDCSVHIFLSNA